tara:strand:+ start:257 stop:436 length:180 start_codon:yes stop_codon:yes gene_type:complete
MRGEFYKDDMLIDLIEKKIFLYKTTKIDIELFNNCVFDIDNGMLLYIDFEHWNKKFNKK